MLSQALGCCLQLTRAITISARHLNMGPAALAQSPDKSLCLDMYVTVIHLQKGHNEKCP